MNESMKEWMKNVLHTHKSEPWIEYTIAQAIGFLILNFMWKHKDNKILYLWWLDHIPKRAAL